LLELAAPGYLDDHDWHEAGEGPWFEQALKYTDESCHGVLGLLSRIYPRDGRPASDATYRLADYVEQTGRTQRAGTFPPGSFWEAAAASIVDPQVLSSIARSAEQRGRYRRAIQFYRRAIGRTDALSSHAKMRDQAGDQGNAEAFARPGANRGDTTASSLLARLRAEAADRHRPRPHTWQAANRGDTTAPPSPAQLLAEAADRHRARALAEQAAKRGSTSALPSLARFRTRTLAQAATHGDTRALSVMAWQRADAGDREGAAALAQQAANHGDTTALLALAERRTDDGDYHSAELLYQQGANHGNATALSALAWLREQAGDPKGAGYIRRFGLTDDGLPAASLD